MKMNTSVKTYKREGKTITIVGVCHIGEKKYYKSIQNELDKTTHDVVLFEKVKGFEHLGINKIYSLFADMINLNTQKNSIEYRDGWIRSDLDADVLLSANPKVIPISENDISDILKHSDIEITKFERFIIRTLLKNVKIFHLFYRKKPVLVDLRNYKVILDTFQLLSKHKSVCLFYGEGHLSGIEKFIKQTGFKKTKEYKLKVL